MTGFSLFGRGWLVTKKELAKAISEELGITSVLALQAVQRVFDGITKTLVEKGQATGGDVSAWAGGSSAGARRPRSP